MLIVAIPSFVLVMALGLYLLARETDEMWLRQLGIGLVAEGAIFAWLIIVRHWSVWLFVGLSLVMVIADSLLAQRKIVALGEAFWPDLARNVLGAALLALLFALPIVVAMALATGPTQVMITLLLATVTLAMATQLFASPLQRGIDHLAFAHRPQLQESRATLRETADALPRSDAAFVPLEQTEDEFAKLTRRAISHLGDLPRLSASPLIQLPAVDARLRAQQQADNTLARAAVLRDLLVESILWLKPDAGPESGVAFDSSDAWRHYNALYFPYVLGMKPYSRRATHDNLESTAQEALAWFQAQVPERTLYNWQNAAAKLVAQHLREVTVAQGTEVTVTGQS